MKKALSIIAGMSMLLSLVSCSEAAEKPSAESQVETVDYTTLDSSWECDYFKIGTNSHWEADDSLIGDLTLANWYWADKDNYHSIYFSISHADLYKKLTQDDAKTEWEQLKDSFMTDDDFKNDKDTLERYDGYFVERTFVKNGQAYLIIAKEGDTDAQKRIEFYADSLHGTLSYYQLDEQIVLDMIDSIVFY